MVAKESGRSADGHLGYLKRACAKARSVNAKRTEKCHQTGVGKLRAKYNRASVEDLAKASHINLL